MATAHCEACEIVRSNLKILSDFDQLLTMTVGSPRWWFKPVSRETLRTKYTVCRTIKYTMENGSLARRDQGSPFNH